MSQFQARYQKARRSIKKRIETKALINPEELNKQYNIELSVQDPLKDAKPTIKLAED